MNLNRINVAFWIAFYLVVVASVAFGIAGITHMLDGNKIADRNARSMASELDFSNGNYRIVVMPESSFGLFFPDLTMITVENNKGMDIFLLPSGDIIKAMGIEESPGMEINLNNVKTWTWVCDYEVSGSDYNSETDVHSGWAFACGAQSPVGEAFTRKADAVAELTKHNEETGHDADLFETLPLRPVADETE